MKKKLLTIPLMATLITLTFIACGPIKEIHRNDLYSGPEMSGKTIEPDPNLQTVVILASNEGTEIFDLMAPYEIFSLTRKLNVIVLAPEKKVLPLWKGLYLMPHMSLEEFDQLGINPSLVVIPNIVNPENQQIIDWINQHKSASQYILSVCEGARVVAHSQLYSGSKLTTHHSSIGKIEKTYPAQQWIRGFRFIEDGNLLSTSGVSAAVEGSLLAVEKLLGKESTTQVMDKIAYPSEQIQLELNDSHMRFGDMLRIVAKTGFTKNKRLGVYIPDHVSELEIAAIIDTYNRTLPARLETFSMHRKHVMTRNGLLLIPSTTYHSSIFDEIIIPNTGCQERNQDNFVKEFDIRDELTFFNKEDYIFHSIHHELRSSYAKGFTKTVYRLLDYNIEQALIQSK